MLKLPIFPGDAAPPAARPHGDGAHARPRKPEWLKVRAPGGERYSKLKELLRGLDLHTVCEEARCPNIGECWGGGTMTIMLLGDTCTRGCRFCNVKTSAHPPAPDAAEPVKVASAIAELGLDYVVLTMVDRDDIPDGGAAHVAETVREIKRRDPRVLVEVLVGDFLGDMDAVDVVARSGADVLAHNLETVDRLQRSVRDARCSSALSLAVLARLKATAPAAVTKSSLMLGLGETALEIDEAARALRGAGVEVLTLGQYLRPSDWHLPVHEFVTPEAFEAHRLRALAMGYAFVASGPLVRSSYKAGEKFLESHLGARAGRREKERA